MQKLKKEYIDTGKLRLIVRDFPLPFHKNARPAANAAHWQENKISFGLCKMPFIKAIK